MLVDTSGMQLHIHIPSYEDAYIDQARRFFLKKNPPTVAVPEYLVASALIELLHALTCLRYCFMRP